MVQGSTGDGHDMSAAEAYQRVDAEAYHLLKALRDAGEPLTTSELKEQTPDSVTKDHLHYRYETLQEAGLIKVEETDDYTTRVHDGTPRTYRTPHTAALTDRGHGYSEATATSTGWRKPGRGGRRSTTVPQPRTMRRVTTRSTKRSGSWSRNWTGTGRHWSISAGRSNNGRRPGPIESRARGRVEGSHNGR